MKPSTLSLFRLRRHENAKRRMALSGLVACRRVLRAMAWFDDNAPSGWEDRLRKRGLTGPSIVAYGSYDPDFAGSYAFGTPGVTLGDFLARFGKGFEWARAHGMFIMPNDLVTEPVLVEVWNGFLGDSLDPEHLVLRHLT